MSEAEKVRARLQGLAKTIEDSLPRRAGVLQTVAPGPMLPILAAMLTDKDIEGAEHSLQLLEKQDIEG